MSLCFLVLLLLVIYVTTSTAQNQNQNQLHMDNDYFYQDPEMDDVISLNNEMQEPPEANPRKYYFSGVPRSAMVPMNEQASASATDSPTECGLDKTSEKDKTSSTTTECASDAPTASSTTAASVEVASTTASGTSGTSSSTAASASSSTDFNSTTTPATTSIVTTTLPPSTTSAATTINPIPVGTGNTQTSDQEAKSKELRNLVQHLYIAQARVQLEATEIKKSQAVANVAQQQLEEAAGHVRSVTAALQNAQQEVAAAAIRAQTAQLQLAAHDQLLFAARQDVDALSSQMVGLQAAEGISAPRITFDVTGLLEKLRQPLPDDQKPTPVPAVVPMPHLPGASGKGKAQRMALQELYYE